MPDEAAAQEPTVEEELEVAEFLEDDEEGEEGLDLDDLEEGDDEGEEGPSGEEAPPEEPEPSPELQALQEQNENLKGWAGRMRHENRALQERQERFEERYTRLLEALAKAQGVSVEDLETPPEEKIPDEDEDFAGHVEGRVRKSVQDELQKFYDQIQGRDAQKEVGERIDQVRQYHEADIARFEQQHPDYDDAEAFVLEATQEDLRKAIRRQHPRAPQDQVEQAVQAQLMDIVARHQLQFAMDGASLAEYVYQQALEGGYQPNGQQPTAKKKPARGGSADDLRERRKKAGTSLAAVSGSPGGGKGLERLLDMDDDEYAAAMDKIEKSGKDFEHVARKILA